MGYVCFQSLRNDSIKHRTANVFRATKTSRKKSVTQELSSLFSSLLFSSGQTAVKLSGAEAADRAQCAAPDNPIGY